MKIYLRKIVSLSLLLLTLVGCTNAGSQEGGKKMLKHKGMESVQDYTGEGYYGKRDKETERIIKRNYEELETFANDYMMEHYKTGAEITSYIPLKNMAIVLFKTTKKPEIHASFYVPVDRKNRNIIYDFGTREGMLDQSIITGLYHYAYEKEFAHLNEEIEKIKKEYPVASLTKEANEKTYTTNYRTENYYMSFSSLYFSSIIMYYKEQNEDINQEELRSMIEPIDLSTPETIPGIMVHLFMEETGLSSDRELVGTIAKELRKVEGLARGEYSIILHSNYLFEKSTNGVDSRSTVIKTQLEVD